jgi:uncharacterized protein DUF2844
MVCPRRFPIHWFAALLMLVLPIAAFAALGEDESTIPADQAQMRASLRVTRTANYAVHEMQTPAGHLIREYASPTGTVFGVAWQGPSKPDLRQLLGAHFDEFIQAAQAAQANRHGHGPLTINQPGLVVQSGGHMRAFVGRAYLPQVLPQGVRPEDIQ